MSALDAQLNLNALVPTASLKVQSFLLFKAIARPLATDVFMYLEKALKNLVVVNNGCNVQCTIKHCPSKADGIIGVPIW